MASELENAIERVDRWANYEWSSDDQIAVRSELSTFTAGDLRLILSANRKMREALERIAEYRWPVIVGHRMVPFSVPETGYHSETKEAVASESPLQALKSVTDIARDALSPTQPEEVK